MSRSRLGCQPNANHRYRAANATASPRHTCCSTAAVAVAAGNRATPGRASPRRTFRSLHTVSAMAGRTDWRGTFFGISAGAVVAGVGLMTPVHLVSVLLVVGGVTGMVVSVVHRFTRPPTTAIIGILTLAVLGSGATRFWPHQIETVAGGEERRQKPRVSVVLLYGNDRLVVQNTSTDDVFVGGDKFGTTPKYIDGKLRMIPGLSGGSTYYYYFITDDLHKWITYNVGMNGETTQGFEIYLEDTEHAKYIARFDLLIKIKEGVMDIHTQQLGISKEEW